MDPKKHPDLEFAYGSGHLNPTDAINPGLVYDANETDYINFLCKQGYNDTNLRLITGDNSSVCYSTEPGRAWDLNYPSFSLALLDGQEILADFTRTVTNVGSPNSTYTARVYMPPNINVEVKPSTLSFSSVGETQSFTLTVNGPPITQQPIMSGAIIWEDGDYQVRSPIVIYNIFSLSPISAFYASQQSVSLKFKGPSMYTKNGILGRN